MRKIYGDKRTRQQSYNKSLARVACLKRRYATEEYKAYQRAYQAAYARTKKRKAYDLKRRATPESRAYHAAYAKKYRTTEKARQKQQRYLASSGYKDYMRAYDAMPARKLKDKTRRLSSYGLTLAQYEAMLAEQAGVCAVCGGTNANGFRLHVDHCHETGKVRGLLCGKCNLALGNAQDNVHRLLQLAQYALDRC